MLEELFWLLYSADESIFTALYKLEIPFDDKYKKLVHCLQAIINCDTLNGSWTDGLHVDFEWFSAGESHLTLLFSAIYQRISELSIRNSESHVVLLIDEPEMHMHPETSRIFIDKLSEAFNHFRDRGLLKSCQVILASHSPFIIQALGNTHHSISLVTKEKSEIKIADFSDNDLIRYEKDAPYSFGLVMHYIFGVDTIELHNELYGELQERSSCYGLKDMDSWLHSKGIISSRQWIKMIKGVPQPPEKTTMQTYIRNSIHHPENKYNTAYTKEELSQSIKTMISLL